MELELPVIRGGLEIGRINLKNESFMVNKEAPIEYNCKMTGDCCNRFHIPVTDFDIKRIEDHG